MRFASVLALVLVGCGSVSTHFVVTGPQRARYSGEVAVYLESQAAPPQMTEVAIVQAHGNGDQANLEAVLAGLRRQAALLGADAVIRVRFDQGAGNASAIGVAVVTAPAVGASPDR